MGKKGGDKSVKKQKITHKNHSLPQECPIRIQQEIASHHSYRTRSSFGGQKKSILSNDGATLITSRVPSINLPQLLESTIKNNEEHQSITATTLTNPHIPTTSSSLTATLQKGQSSIMIKSTASTAKIRSDSGISSYKSQAFSVATQIEEDRITQEDFESLTYQMESKGVLSQRKKRLKIQKSERPEERVQKMDASFQNPLPKKRITKKHLQQFQQQDTFYEDIFNNLTETIVTYNYRIPSNPHATKPGPSLTFKKRILLIDNIIKLGVYFSYHRPIVHLAIALFDSLFLQPGFSFKEKPLQLYAITSLFISAKKEDSKKLSLDKYVEFISQYSHKDFISCELQILNVLKWQINPLSLEVVNGVLIELLERKYFGGCGYMKGNPIFQFRLNVFVDLINLKQNLSNFQFCILRLSLSVIYVTVTLTEHCFTTLEQAQIELTENIFHIGSLCASSCNSTTFTKINELFSLFMRKYFRLDSISDIALEVQYIAKFLDFFNDPTLYSNVKKHLSIQADYQNAIEFLTTSKFSP